MYPRNAPYLLLLLALPLRAQAEECTFSPSAWSVVERQGVALPRVQVDRAELDPSLVGPWGCTPCEQDQVEITLRSGLSARLCHAMAEPVRAALERAVDQGAQLESLLGYRPSRSKGQPDTAGLRTQWSHHAFGLALDVNAYHNGLYRQCTSWGPGCELIIGGPWAPGHALSLTPEHPVVRELEAVGLRWGGRLEGDQKDFMHFSPDGS